MRIGPSSGWLMVVALLISTPALAYVGPGAGLTLLSALWGLLVAVLAAVAFLVLWPLRRWRRRRQALEAGAQLDGDGITPGADASAAESVRAECRRGTDQRPGAGL